MLIFLFLNGYIGFRLWIFLKPTKIDFYVLIVTTNKELQVLDIDFHLKQHLFTSIFDFLNSWKWASLFLKRKFLRLPKTKLFKSHQKWILSPLPKLQSLIFSMIFNECIDIQPWIFLSPQNGDCGTNKDFYKLSLNFYLKGNFYLNLRFIWILESGHLSLKNGNFISKLGFCQSPR